MGRYAQANELLRDGHVAEAYRLISLISYDETMDLGLPCTLTCSVDTSHFFQLVDEKTIKALTSCPGCGASTIRTGYTQTEPPTDSQEGPADSNDDISGNNATLNGHPTEPGLSEAVRRLRGDGQVWEVDPDRTGAGEDAPDPPLPSAQHPIGEDGASGNDTRELETVKESVGDTNTLVAVAATRRLSRTTLRRPGTFLSGAKAGLVGPILVVGVGVQLLWGFFVRPRNSGSHLPKHRRGRHTRVLA